MDLWRAPGCPGWCGGHIDDSSTESHSLELGTAAHGFITVSQDPGLLPVIALEEFDSPRHTMGADAARLLGAFLWRGAGIVDRYTFPLAADPVERMLWELLDQREVHGD